MKTFLTNKIFLSLLLLAVCVLPIKAQKGDPNLNSQNRHYFTISLAGGATGFAMMPSYGGILSPNANYDGNASCDKTFPEVLPPDSLRIKPFLGGSFGLGYEFQNARGFWFSVGLEGQIYSGGLHHTDSIHRLDRVLDGNVETGIDTADIEYTVINWNERQTVASVNLPFMFGYKHESGFYGGVGVKFGFSVYTSLFGDFGFADCNLYYNGVNDIVGIYKSLPFDSVRSKDDNFLSLPRVTPMVEFGWQNLELDINKKHRMRFKFALVGEFDLLTAYKNSDSAEELFNYSSLSGFRPEDLPGFFKHVNSFYSTIPLGMSQKEFDALKNEGKFLNYAKPSSLHSWFVGVKVGIMFEMPRRKECNCLNNNVMKPWYKKFKDKGVE